MTSRYTFPTLADYNREQTIRENARAFTAQVRRAQFWKAVQTTLWTAGVVVAAFLLWLLHDYSFEAGRQSAKVEQHFTPRPVPAKPAVYDWMGCEERARVCAGRIRTGKVGM